MVYRRLRQLETWHFCTNCTSWPTANYHESEEPTTGELCEECKLKEARGDCHKAPSSADN